MAQHPLLVPGIGSFPALVGEPTELRPCLAQKGLLILNVTAQGETAHAARAHLGKNALTVAARDLLAIDAMTFEKSDPLLGTPTITATMIEGGTAKNVVPDRCRITLDIRSTPATTHPELTALVREALESRVEVHSERIIPCSTDPDSRVAQAAVAAVLVVLGLISVLVVGCCCWPPPVF
mgnify:CR=1 FL=1